MIVTIILNVLQIMLKEFRGAGYNGYASLGSRKLMVVTGVSVICDGFVGSLERGIKFVGEELGHYGVADVLMDLDGAADGAYEIDG